MAGLLYNALIAWLIIARPAVIALANVAMGSGFTSDFIFRGFFLCLTAILASFLREQAQQANADL